MGKLHKNAALTIAQRKELRSLYLSGTSISDLVKMFRIGRTTAKRWAKRDNPHDLPSGATTTKRVITPAYRKAVIAHRKANPTHGARTIAYYLLQEFPFAKRGTIQAILTEEKLSQKLPRKTRDKKT